MRTVRDSALVVATLVCGLFTFVTPALANNGPYLEQRFEATRYRGMGGAEIALDPSTPANGALGGGFELTILSVDAYSTLSEGIRAAQLGYDIYNTEFQRDLQNEQDLRTLEAQISDISDRIVGDEFHLELHGRVEFMNALINTESLSIQLGAYSELLGGGRFVTPSQVELVENPSDTYIDFGNDTRVFRGGARMDTGAFVGLGTMIPVGENFRFAFGGRVRGFYRILLEEIRVDVDAEVRNSADIDFDEPSTIRGYGAGLDLYTSMHFSEDLTGFRVAAYIEDVLTYVAQDNDNFFVPPRVGVGMSWVSSDEAFTFALDLERVETLDPSVQLGLSYRAGSEKIGLTPMFGAVLNHRDITGTTLPPTLTLGLRLSAGIVHIATVAEVRTGDPSFNGGLSFALAF